MAQNIYNSICDCVPNSIDFVKCNSRVCRCGTTTIGDKKCGTFAILLPCNRHSDDDKTWRCFAGYLLHADFGKQSGLCYPQKAIVSESFDSTNIVIIAIDSWNYRALCNEIMPHTVAYANQNELFTNHLSSSNGTRGSIFGMFFGVSSYYWKDFDVTGTTPVMLDELNKRHYTIRTFPSATLNPNFPKLLFRNSQGICPSTEGNSVYERDCRLTSNFISFLDSTQTSSPFFAFLFYDLAHSFEYPEYLPKKFTPSWDFADYMKLNNDMDPTPYWNLYCNCISVVDSLVNEAVSAIEKRGLDKNTLIFITGDHGQEFNENHKNYWGHGSNYTYPQIHIPLIVHQPKQSNKIFAHRTTHYDISTTILQDVLGVTNPHPTTVWGSICTTPRSGIGTLWAIISTMLSLLIVI